MLNKRFWYMRTGTLIWGFTVSWAFTGKLIVAIPMFTTMVIGNSLIMYFSNKL